MSDAPEVVGDFKGFEGVAKWAWWSIRLQFQTWSHHSPVRTWTSHVTSLRLSFLINKMGTMAGSTTPIVYIWVILCMRVRTRHDACEEVKVQAHESVLSCLAWDRVFCSLLCLPQARWPTNFWAFPCFRYPCHHRTEGITDAHYLNLLYVGSDDPNSHLHVSPLPNPCFLKLIYVRYKHDVISTKHKLREH